VPSATQLGLLVQRVAYAGLDGLRGAIPLDLCAYLQTTTDAGPQLYLRAPDLSKMDATAAFSLFSAVRDTLETQESESGITPIDGFESFTVVIEGVRSRGLFVLGRREYMLDSHEQEVALALCRAVGAVSNAISDSGLAGTEPLPMRIAVEVSDGQAHAEVMVSRAGETHTGKGEAPSASVAVATATLDAFDPTLKLIDCREEEIGAERAVLILVRDESGASALGSSLSGTDQLQATAGAALQAADRLSSGQG